MTYKLFWIGIAPTDISEINHLFDGLITIIGNDDKKEFYSLENKIQKRINYNDINNFNVINEFLFENINNLIKKYKNIKFLWQDQLNFCRFEDLNEYFIYNNNFQLIDYLCDKAHIRSLVSRIIKSVPSFTLLKSECSYREFKKLMPESNSFVCQKFSGSGGTQTVLIEHKDDDSFLNKLNSPLLLISKYIENSIPLNQHIIVTSSEIITLPISIQIVKKSKEKNLLYKGADYSAINIVNTNISEQIYISSKKIGDLLKANGYRGVLGIDYITDNKDLFFIEINPRFQSSTKLLNKNLVQQNLPSVHDLHIKAFENEEINFPTDFKAKGSILYGINDSKTKYFLESKNIYFTSPETRDSEFSNDSITINIDNNNLQNNIEIENNARLFNIYIDRQIVHYNQYEGVSINYAIESYTQIDRANILNLNKNDFNSIAKFKFELFSHGLLLAETAKNELINNREDLTIRDGIAGGLEIILFDNIYINVPIKEYFVALSPYRLEFIDEKFYIFDEVNNSVEIKVLPIPDFVGKFTTKGTPMVEVGQMMSERLSLEVFFGCINTWKNNTACKFCELGAEKDMTFVDEDDIRELVKYCVNSKKIDIRHVLIGGGTPPKKLLYRYVDTVKIVKKVSNLSTYIMMSPPSNLSILDNLKESGLDEIGFNLEVYDRDIAKEIMPQKGLISKEYYFKTFSYAVKLFGNEGQVRSILIVGIESIENTLQAVEELVSIGVMPLLSPFRPIPNTPMANHPLPSPELLYEVWEESERIVSKYGMCLGPFCIACQNNTIAVPTKKEYKFY